MATTKRAPSSRQYKQMVLAERVNGVQWYTTASIGEDDYMRLSSIWKALREKRLNYDGYKCQKCKKAAYNLQVHHIRYPEVWGEETIDDLVTLCDECHKNIHNLGGN